MGRGECWWKNQEWERKRKQQFGCYAKACYDKVKERNEVRNVEEMWERVEVMIDSTEGVWRSVSKEEAQGVNEGMKEWYYLLAKSIKGLCVKEILFFFYVFVCAAFSIE